MNAAVSGKRTRFYSLESYKLKNGSQLPRLHDYFSQALLPSMAKVHTGPKIFMEALVAPHMPQVAVVYGFESLEEMAAIHSKLSSDSEFRNNTETLESGAEPPFESLDTTLLEAAPYSPEVPIAGEGSKPRIFELRVYHSPTYRQLKALHERFAGPEIRIFHRVGVHPLLYSSTLIGQNLPNLAYLIPFDDLSAREKAWNAFNADPEWIKVRKESIDRSGQIASTIQISLWRAAAYSPVR